jgi:L-threonylcarbamoyladenylate synthase
VETRFLAADRPGDIEAAAKLLRANQVVALPTETVYGLAANALSEGAVAEIYRAKQRPADNPLIVHVTGTAQAFKLTEHIPTAVVEMATSLMAAFWPGPLTIILPKCAQVPDIVTAGRPDVGLRCPAHPAFQAVLEACGFPLAAPSANPAGRPSPTTARQVFAELHGRIPAVLDGGPATVGLESTVLSLSAENGQPLLLRPGGVTLEALEALIGPVVVDQAVHAPLVSGQAPSAPGMKYRHYAPVTPLEIFPGSPTEALEYLAKHSAERIGILGFAEHCETFKGFPFVAYGSRFDGAAQAHSLFGALRQVDELQADRVLAFPPPAQDGMFAAVQNRLRKAAGFKEVSGY